MLKVFEMEHGRYRRLYDLHSWSGVIFGLFIFIVSISGSFALFHEEVLSWEDPARRLPKAEFPAPLHNKFENWVSLNAEGKSIDFLKLSYPDSVTPYYEALLITKDDAGDVMRLEQRWNAETAENIPRRGAGVSDWIWNFHRDLMWPDQFGGRTMGLALVGVAGVVLLLSIISGVLIHRKIFSQIFTLRVHRSQALKWNDAHKVFGIWGLPFYAMVAFTGSVLGIVIILAPIVATLSFKGDQQAVYDAVFGEKLAPAGVESPMFSLDRIASFSHPESRMPIAHVVIENWGDVTARYELQFPADKEMALLDAYKISGVTGERVAYPLLDTPSNASRFVNAVAPLHYGSYGGLALKLLYFLLGLSLAIISALGVLMWIDRRRNGGKKYKSLHHILTGVTAGAPLTYGAIFILDKIYLGAEASRLAWTGVLFFTIWLAAIVYVFIRKNDRAAFRET
ncbi:MAG: PepSY-associated TM helix domain-containing protein, partial [Sphingomonadales bacterium]